MNEQRRQAYLTLIQSLLNSPKDEKITILQANLELLDNGFAQYLREWATQTLAAMESEAAYNFASNIYSFNIVIGDFPLGSRANNLEIAIVCDEIALIVWNRDDYPEKWAMIQNSMAIDYSNRIREDKAENIEKAIACYDLALLVRTRAAFPQDWAMTQNNLAIAYSDRIREDKAENIEKAIACYELALLVYTRPAFPQDWAMTQNNLATAYCDRIKGDRGDNLERAIAFCEAALLVYTRPAFPQDWATTQNNLANAYSNRIREDKAENIEKAIACYELALLVRTRAAFPQDWATTQNNLANAYSDRIKEDKAENIERAIACYELALLVDTPTTLPLDCLQTARNLGNLAFTESFWETAIFGYEKAIEAVEQSREWMASENRKREIIEENLNIYEKMIQSCINHQQYHKAIQTIERSKSRYLVELFTNSEIYPKTATESEKQQLRDLRRQIAAIQQSLETETPVSPPISPLPPPLTKGGPGGVPIQETGEIPDSPPQRTTQTRTQTPEFSQQQQEKLATALQQLEQFLETFKQREPEFKLTQKIQPTDIAKFQKTLDPKTAIIEWYISSGGHAPSTAPTGGFAFIITRDKIKYITYTTTEIAELETWKNNYIDEYRDKKTNKTWQTTLSQKLEKLSQILRLKEIADKIPPTSQQLILVPHRYLHLFPLHALPLEGPHAPSTAPTRNLLDGFPEGVKYAPSLQLLELVKNRTATRKSIPPNQQQFFALQNPTEDLFNADMEVETIKTRFGDLHQILLRKQATKTALNQNRENLANANYLHFSCHGVFDFDYPLLSSLVLADSLEPRAEINPSQAPEINPPQPPLAQGGLREENAFAKGGLREENGLAQGGLEENTFAQGGLREENTLAQGGLREENALAQGGLREENTFAQGGLREENALAQGGIEDEGLKTRRYITLRNTRKANPEKCLNLRDIFGELQLPKCSLVTLSACETGLTTSTAMTDEYIGLPSAFLYAGSMNVVSSLWAVDDFATAILMIKFYQELPKADSVAIALNAAQNWMRGVSREGFEVWVGLLKLDEKSMESANKWLSYLRKGKSPFGHPKYWAAFCATGY